MVTEVEIDPAGAGTVSIETSPDAYGGTLITFRASPNRGFGSPFWEYYYRAGYGSDLIQYHGQTGTTSTSYRFTDIYGGGAYDYSQILDRMIAHFTSSPTPVDSAINLSLISNPADIGNLSGGGLRTGEVGASVSYSVLAEIKDAKKDLYRFSHWIDDDGVRYSLKQFSKSFSFKSGYTESNPEQKVFTAYFVPIGGTGLILRSSSSGLILRGKANRILRDE